MTDIPTICPDCRVRLALELRERADHHYALSARQWPVKRTRGNAKVNRRMAVAFAWCAGILTRGGLG